MIPSPFSWEVFCFGMVIGWFLGIFMASLYVGLAHHFAQRMDE